jgi:two-component system cell cycle response regulator
VKPDQVDATKFNESSETAMITKSAPTEKQDRKSPAIQATEVHRDARTINSCFVNENSAESLTQKTRQPLIKILLCDDDPADCELLRTCLQQMTDREIALLPAGHIREIQNALDKGRIDLVLMDSQMPGKPGMAWLAEISKKQLAPVVILTGAGTEEVATQTFREEALGYLPKCSLSLDKLSNIINVTLNKWTRLQQASATKEELERLATLDLLTGLYNRQTIIGELRELINLANRYKEDFSLSMLDIDHFRKVNDSYGHLIGDEVLEKIADLVRGNIRDVDIAGRYGGEEFIILLPKTNLASSWVGAERLRSIIEKTELKDSAGNVFAVTVSQGLVGWERNDDAPSLISRADEALRKAQQKGRNRVQILLGPSLRDKV